MHDMELPESLKAVARAQVPGTNNIPIDKCSEKGIVVFNTPGANANAVKELVIAGMLLASRDVIGGVATLGQIHLPAMTLTSRLKRVSQTSQAAKLRARLLV